ncbi:MAG: malonic semialdehyde reductase [Chitinophagaceae bacterium]|nr:malonic semialdehyde reductase [Oligoflexus sp.]
MATTSSSSPSITLQQIFHNARSHNAWLDKPVSDETLHQVYEAMEWGPTAANSLPARILFVKKGPQKDKLLEAMAPGNVDKTKAAPVTAVLAYDLEFYEKLPKTFPHADARSWFAGNDQAIKDTAEYNSALQHGYFIIAARSFGLDCGPMAGFDKKKMDELFFKGTSWRSAMVCNIGYGDTAQLFPRSPRLSFDEACKILG